MVVRFPGSLTPLAIRSVLSSVFLHPFPCPPLRLAIRFPGSSAPLPFVLSCLLIFGFDSLLFSCFLPSIQFCFLLFLVISSLLSVPCHPLSCVLLLVLPLSYFFLFFAFSLVLFLAIRSLLFLLFLVILLLLFSAISSFLFLLFLAILSPCSSVLLPSFPSFPSLPLSLSLFCPHFYLFFAILSLFIPLLSPRSPFPSFVPFPSLNLPLVPPCLLFILQPS